MEETRFIGSKVQSICSTFTESCVCDRWLAVIQGIWDGLGLVFPRFWYRRWDFEATVEMNLEDENGSWPLIGWSYDVHAVPVWFLLWKEMAARSPKS